MQAQIKAAYMGIGFEILPVLVSGIPARADGQERKQRRRQPNHQQHDEHTTMRHYKRIVQRLHNGIVPEITECVCVCIFGVPVPGICV